MHDLEHLGQRAGPGAKADTADHPRQMKAVAGLILFGMACAFTILACDNSSTNPQAMPEVLDPVLVAQGQHVFRDSTYEDERFWTDTARMHEVVQRSVSPALALQVGLKVDADALPQGVKDALASGQVDLNSPATTVTLLKLGAVVGLKGTVQTVGGRDTLTRLGITCALCHSTVDNSFAPGIGRRLDGHQNSDLNVGAIIALSPAIPAGAKAVYNSWGPGRYDARYNFDGLSLPALIPPVYGLNGIRREISTGDDTLSYWNAYVAVTQMHGQGTFRDPRLGVSIVKSPDVVVPLLPALRQYQLSLSAPRPAAGSFDAAAAGRGQALFNGVATCSSCHTGALLTDVNAGVLHVPAEVGQSAAFANRSVTKRYRTTPLRALALHGPYFHDGSATTLADVVTHYDRLRSLNLSAQQRSDLVEYLKSL